MQVANAPSSESAPGTHKRPGEFEDRPEDGVKARRLSEPLPTPGGSCHSPRNHLADQLPSPSLTKCNQGLPSQTPPLPLPSASASSPPDHPVSRKRKANPPNCAPAPKRGRSSFEGVSRPSKLDWWLSNLVDSDDFEDSLACEHVEDMNQLTSKRSPSQSSDSLRRALSQSVEGSETTVSREKKYSVYKDVNYQVVLETKGSFMRPSQAGMAEEDEELCQRLLTASQPIVSDPLFSNDFFSRFHSNLRGRSEARICLDLHPRLLPSVENLCICGREEFAGLIEGHNDPWVKAIPFYGPRPQPDHTYGFKWSNFSEQQRRKLMIDPTKKSYYTAREDIYFPFLTAEVKCGKQGLDLADMPNMHSMTVHMRGIVDLYRKINRPKDVHRRVLGFSVSHDDNGERIHAYYPEINGDETTYWRATLKEFWVGSDHGRDKWTSYRFTLNVCQLFALPLLERLKGAIDELPDPLSQSQDFTTALDAFSVEGSQYSLSECQDETFKKPRSARGLNAELRNMIQSLQRQLERQAEEARERERCQAEEARERERRQAEEARERERRQAEEAKEREALLQAQLEQQKKSEQQLHELIGMLKEQREERKGPKA